MVAANQNEFDWSRLAPKTENRSLKEQEYLGIKHALPKTRISHAILHENTSADRHLNMKLTAISHRQNKLSNTFDQNKRNFIETQMRKNKKWKSQDEMGAATMNFPYLRSDNRRQSMVVVYKSPQYYEKEEEAVREAGVIGKLLPYMEIRRERTEILQHHGVTYTTKLPTVIEQDDKKLKRYNTYCGVENDHSMFGKPVKDDRFTKILNTLTPREGPAMIDSYHFKTDDDDFSGYDTDDDIPYGNFGGKTNQRFNRGRPPVVFPSLSKAKQFGASDSNADGRFNSPTLKRSFGVKSAKR